MYRFPVSFLLFLFLTLVCATIGSKAYAGGGPENTLLIVNAKSASSTLLANHYRELRDIPFRNVIYLPNVPNSERIQLIAFRERILKPMIAEVERRKLGDQIDCVVYSADFPTQIAFNREYESLKTGKSKINRPGASINSLTYFMQDVMRNDLSFMGLGHNRYMRDRNSLLLNLPFDNEGNTALFKDAVRHLRAGKVDQAREEFESLHQKHPRQVAITYWLARTYGLTGDVDEACKWLTRSVANGWSYRLFTQSDPSFAKIVRDRQFEDVLLTIPNQSYRNLPTMGFKSQYHFGPNGMINSDSANGRAYLLSTVLAVTRNLGNSEKDALAQIKRSVKSDGTRPRGKFYFTKTNDVRSTTRQPNYERTIDELRTLGFQTEVIRMSTAKNQKDIVGMTIGTARFDLSKANIRIAPGAICENLTSYGGRLDKVGQTPLTEFLKYGAAGSSGTVIEPYAIQAKFPHPRIHVHYVRGCSLAEAFYQSVHGPFQLLIVGDALCQPWARIPGVKVTNLEPFAEVSGDQAVELEFGGAPSSRLELYVDGRRVRTFENTDQLSFDSKTLADGYHEARIVAVGKAPIGTTGRAILEFIVNNHDERVQLNTAGERFSLEDELTFEVNANFGDEIELVHNYRVLKTVKGQSGKFKVPAKAFGRGPVTVMAQVKNARNQRVQSKPVQFEIFGPLKSSPTLSKPLQSGNRKAGGRKK